MPVAALPRGPVQAVRAFNRFYTRQIGVLEEHLLGSQCSLTEVRVLYEIAHRRQASAKDLCGDLGLDPGYVSRMLQSFAARGWVKAVPSPEDRRRRLLFLTGKGHAVFDPLDRRSSDQVHAMLARLSAAQQEKMLGAIADIESVLAPAEATSPACALRQPRPGDMGWVVQRHGELYWRQYHYDERFEALVARIVSDFVQNHERERERCWIAEQGGQNVGCIFLVKKSAAVAQLRLLLVDPSARGLGIGRQLVNECLRFASQAAYKKILLWTQSELSAARHIYQAAGFQCIARRPHQSWSRKDLVAETWARKL